MVSGPVAVAVLHIVLLSESLHGGEGPRQGAPWGPPGWDASSCKGVVGRGAWSLGGEVPASGAIGVLLRLLGGLAPDEGLFICKCVC